MIPHPRERTPHDPIRRGRRSAVVGLRVLALVAVAMLALVAACGNGADSVATETPGTSEPPLNLTPSPERDATNGATEIEGPVASTAEIPTDELPRVRFAGPSEAEAELAIEAPPRNEYTVGLSGRATLEDGRGMLFYYPPGDYTGGFWMRNTHFDLDIAFVDVDLAIIAILRMEANTEETQRPPDPYLAAIEARAGWFADHGIGEGAAVEFLFDLDAHYE